MATNFFAPTQQALQQFGRSRERRAALADVQAEKQQQLRLQVAGNLAAGVLTASDPVQAFKAGRQVFLKRFPDAQLPEEFDESFLRQTVAQTAGPEVLQRIDAQRTQAQLRPGLASIVAGIPGREQAISAATDVIQATPGGSLADIQQFAKTFDVARPTVAQKFGTTREGVDPETGKPGFFRIEQRTGIPQFLKGATPVPRREGPLVSLGSEEKAFDKQLGQDLSKSFTEAQARGAETRQSDIRLNRARALVNKVGTGALQPTVQVVKRIIKDFGFDLEQLGLSDDVGLGEALQAIGVDFALEAVQKTKGAITDREMALFASTAPGLSRTTEGNILLIDLRQRMNDLARKEAKLQRDYIKGKGGGRLDSGYFEFRENFWAENPLFTPDLQQRLESIQGATVPEQPAQPGGAQLDPTLFNAVSDDEVLRILQGGQ